ncbi:MAG TPA: tyrosinase family protein [Bradyrhizobium sp.]|jgi:tyrosinase|nr:tyrosinase family protein [Bradyrhizobium sp.]
MIIRKNVKELSATEKANYVNGVKALKTSGTYNSYVQTHNEAMNHTTPNGSNAAHKGPAFLPWHREFILRLEKDIRTAIGDPNFGLPYWDWAADAALPDPKQGPVWAADFMGGEGTPVMTGPFRSGQWTLWPSGSLVRAFAQSVPTLPTSADVAGALAVTPYDSTNWNTGSNPSFRNKLEGWINGPQLHNRVHVWVGGSMLPMTSPNDPVFFLHHCNVDRIWAAWQSRNPGLYLPTSGGPTGHNLNDQMWPWNTTNDQRTPAGELNYPALGYMYDLVSIGSVQFPNVFLRMDGNGVTQPVGSGGGTVNCQYTVGPWEKFRLVPQSDGTVAIGSVQFPNVYLRMDGNGVTHPVGPGGGTVNCQYTVGPWEKFRLLPQGDGTVAIGSVQFPNVYLRMDGNGVTHPVGPGGGTVNCQYTVGPWEKFRLTPIM